MKQKILIAEDDKTIQALYMAGLPKKICDIKIVDDGEQALAAFKEWAPDIVLLDLRMPIVNGYEVLKSIRESEEDSTTTIIMVTSSSEKEDIVACAQLGIQGYIVKPFKTEEIATKILEIHRSAQAIK